MRATDVEGKGKREGGKVSSSVQTFPFSPFPFPLLRKVVSVMKAVAGMPDYERYLEHRRTCHPGEPVLSRREHYLEYVKRRYGNGGGRCC
jgi:uncharacterized short protein YbdD (DUF466 family)